MCYIGSVRKEEGYMEKDKLLVERLSVIEDQQEKLAMIEQSTWFKIGKKFRLL